MENVLKFWKLVTCQKGQVNSAGPGHTASEEAVWSGPSLFAIMSSVLQIPALKTNILFENRRKKMFKIWEHLSYM